jgi:hypothetical protein
MDRLASQAHVDEQIPLPFPATARTPIFAVGGFVLDRTKTLDKRAATLYTCMRTLGRWAGMDPLQRQNRSRPRYVRGAMLVAGNSGYTLRTTVGPNGWRT